MFEEMFVFRPGHRVGVPKVVSGSPAVPPIEPPPDQPSPRLWDFRGGSGAPDNYDELTWLGDNSPVFNVGNSGRFPRNTQGSWSAATLQTPIIDINNFDVEIQVKFRGLAAVGMSEDITSNVMFNGGSQTLAITEGGGIFHEGRNDVTIPAISRFTPVLIRMRFANGGIEADISTANNSNYSESFSFPSYDHVEPRLFVDAAYNDIDVQFIREIEKP